MKWYIVRYLRSDPHRTLDHWDVITGTNDTRNENVRSRRHILIRTVCTCLSNYSRTRDHLALEYTVHAGTTEQVETTNNTDLTEELTTDGADLH